MADIALLDTVALLKDVPEWGLVRGQVGAVVDDAGGESVMVEFMDADGRTITLPDLLRTDLLALKGVPLLAAE
jgi:hypothetical protein